MRFVYDRFVLFPRWFVVPLSVVTSTVRSHEHAPLLSELICRPLIPESGLLDLWHKILRQIMSNSSMTPIALLISTYASSEVAIANRMDVVELRIASCMKTNIRVVDAISLPALLMRRDSS